MNRKIASHDNCRYILFMAKSMSQSAKLFQRAFTQAAREAAARAELAGVKPTGLEAVSVSPGKVKAAQANKATRGQSKNRELKAVMERAAKLKKKRASRRPVRA